jgi:lysophospholipase L1-like esterase
LLRADGAQVADPHIVARTAWTADELSDAIDADRPQGSYDLVFLLVGVNDQYRSRPARAFAAEFARLLRKATAFAGRRPSRVIAISIPDWGATPFAEGRDRARISGEIEAYNHSARELASAAAVQWVDITDVSRRMRTEPPLVAPDGLHPSAEMYRLWAHELLIIAKGALSKKSKRNNLAE